MIKYYEVSLQATMTFVVSAENQEQAMEYAMDGTGCGDYQFFEASAKEIEDRHLDASKRHADLVIED